MTLVCANCGDKSDDPDTCPKCGASPLLEGRYRLDRTIGRGSSGITYRATALQDDRTVCVKELTYRAMGSFDMQELFHREARVLRQLDDPGIPAYVDDFAVESGKNLSLYLVQEFVEGQTLREEMDEHRYTEREVLEILAELADILVYLQRLRPPVFHRDIKPANVMRDDGGRLMLVDFGSVKATTDGAVGGSTITGTFGYMAPEQQWGKATRATDLYGLGVLALVLLTRKDPETFVDTNHELDWKQHLDASEPVVELLEALLEREIEARPDDAEAAEARIDEAIDALDRPAPSTSEPQTVPDQTSEYRSSNRLPDDRSADDSPFVSTETSEADSDGSGLGTGLLILAFFSVGLCLMGLFTLEGDTSSSVSVESAVEVPAASSSEGEPSAFNLEGFDACEGEECVPVRKLFKKNLVFGMSAGEARSAREELTSDSTVSQDLLPTDELPTHAAPAIAPPGPRMTAEMAVGGEPATCTLDFFDDDGLSRLECRASEFDGCDRIEDYTQSSLRKLVERHGKPDETTSNSTDPETNIVMMNSLEETWTWRGADATLHLHVDCTDFSTGSENTTFGGRVVFTQMSSAHRETLRKLQEQKRRQIERREYERKQRERQKEQKLEQLSEEDPL